MATETILEIKEKLSGTRHEFASALLHRGEREAVSLYILPSDGGLGGVPLREGTRCLGFFWEERAYNVYYAVDDAGALIVCYINLSDRTTITPDAIVWRDLIVDVVITPDGTCLVLDEDELPADLDPSLGASIAATRDELVTEHPALLADLAERAAVLLA
jgi:hypothetical protein